VPGPTLPPELLIKIVDLAAPEQVFNFLQHDWAAGVDYATLKALCLTSSVLNALASPLLYRHLVLPTTEAGKRLIRTLNSEAWTTDQGAGKADLWIRSATLGRPVEVGCEVEDGFVGSVLEALAGADLGRVAVVGVATTPTIFERLTRKP
jgi:hypothetical protein